MSSYSNPGQAYYHTLKPLKGWYEDSGIDAAGVLDSNVNIGGTGLPAQRGQIVYAASLQSVGDPYGGTTTGPQLYNLEMGWNIVKGLPMILWTPPTDPDAYNPGVQSGVPAYGTTTNIAEWGSAMPPIAGGNLVALVLSGAYELETTEFDTDQTYLTGQGLRAVTSNTDAHAGQITNQRATTAGFNSAGLVQFGDPTMTAWDSIIGFVSRGKYVNSNKRSALAFYSYPLPGTR